MGIKHTCRVAGVLKNFENYTNRTAIKCFCRECMNGDIREIKKCTDIYCPLYPFRTGETGREKREMTDEEKAKIAERFRKIREERSNNAQPN